MNRTIFSIGGVLLLALLPSFAAAQKNLTAESEKFSYSLGLDIGGNVKNANFDSLDLELMFQGIRDAIKGTPQFNQEQAQMIITAYLNKGQQLKAEQNLKIGQEFLAANAKKKGVVKLPSGLQYEVIKMGSGAKPGKEDEVIAHYTGMLIDGKVFDSSVERGEPLTIGVGQVIAGWTEALQLMPVGSKWKLFIPGNLAYGEQGSPGAIGPNEVLIFEVELLEIKKK